MVRVVAGVAVRLPAVAVGDRPTDGSLEVGGSLEADGSADAAAVNRALSAPQPADDSSSANDVTVISDSPREYTAGIVTSTA
ncbi:hypothetical protein [Allorhizocola rhizosphaerae]|uniref:hypothetical protein n=1 Tax=Allorhizocola rhizosphaerae TaxID=1872709 RepID=UPI001B8D8A7D|nr:hypothetical protein [Allorhizocola rhizosphaerae]